MSRDGSTLLELAGRQHQFKLAIGEWVHLQEAFDAGPYVICEKFYGNSWRVHELITVLRFGLEGGGMPPAEAAAVAAAAVEVQPLVTSLLVVQKLLQIAYAGPADEPPKNAKGGRTTTGSTTSRTARSGSDSSSAQPT